MRRFVSFVNWHLTLLLEHSVQLEVSVASHCRNCQCQDYQTGPFLNTLTFRSRQASQLGSFRRCRYARLCAESIATEGWRGESCDWAMLGSCIIMGSGMPPGIPGLGPIGIPYAVGYAGGGRFEDIDMGGGPAGVEVAEGCIEPGIAYVIGEGCTEPG